MAAKFSITDEIGFGWGVATKNFWLLVKILLIWFFIQLVSGVILNMLGGDSYLINAPLTILVVVLNVILEMGVMRIFLNLAEGKPGLWPDLLSQYPLFFKYLFGQILYTLIVIAGLILLVIPGIVWSIKFFFFGYAVLDKKMGPIDALKESYRITSGAELELFLLGLVMTGVVILGVIPFIGVGLLLTIPTAMAAVAHVYRKLSTSTT